MEEEKITSLLNYLKSAGFEGKRLEEDVRREIAASNHKFNVSHIIAKGEELMRYQLKFEWDMQFDAMRFSGYKASHREKIEIDHKEIDGYDTANLEAKMADIDWISWFRDGKLTLEEDKVSEIEAVLAIISELSARKDIEDIGIIDELCYKYFPLKHYIGEGLEELRRDYENDREFTVYPSGVCHANLAYHILSGKLSSVHELLMQTGLEQFPGADIYGFLEDRLKYDPQKFRVRSTHNTPEGFIEYRIELEQTEKGFDASDNMVTFTPHPAIEHTIIDGIDTAELEMAFREINWEDEDDLYILHANEELELFPHVREIEDKLSILEKSPEGKEIAHSLRFKYWTGSGFMETFIEDSTWKEFHARDSYTATFPLCWDTKVIYNLMCGRYVMDYPLGLEGSNPATWVKLDWSNSKGFFHRIHGPVDKSIDAMLDQLPLDSKLSTRTALKKGDVVWKSIKTIEGTKEIKLVMDPEANTIRIYDKLGMEIPYNFQLSSQQEIQKEVKPGRIIQNNPSNRIRKNGKGI